MPPPSLFILREQKLRIASEFMFDVIDFRFGTNNGGPNKKVTFSYIFLFRRRRVSFIMDPIILMHPKFYIII